MKPKESILNNLCLRSASNELLLRGLIFWLTWPLFIVPISLRAFHGVFYDVERNVLNTERGHI